MRKPKKTINISLKTTEEIKAELDKISEKRDWTTSQVCHYILDTYCREHIKNNENNDTNC